MHGAPRGVEEGVLGGQGDGGVGEEGVQEDAGVVGDGAGEVEGEGRGGGLQVDV